MKLLIVDDHLLFREGLAAIIRSEKDIEITGMAGSVQEAIAMAHEQKPDVILMDFEMPDGDGTDATRAILADQPEAKIVFLTIFEQDERLLSAIRSGAKGYLLKNMRPSQLIAAMRAVYQGEAALSPAMTLRIMQELTRTKAPERPTEVYLAKLTAREVDVLREVAQGASNQTIAQRLYLSENTVKYHIHSILDKLHVADRKEAASYARQYGLVR